jgi:hypothetical protein
MVQRMTGRWRPINHGLLLGFGLLLIGLAAVGSLGYWGWDARAYWAADVAHPYAMNLGDRGAYLYSPAFLQVVGPIARLMPLQVFLAAWTLGAIAALGWLGGRWAALLLLVPPVALEIWYGNIQLLMATAVVLGFRWPGSWAFVLLTKVTPGVGLAWFAARRQWRALTIALGTTAAVAGVSFVLAPALWSEWIGLLTDQAGRPALDQPGVLPLGPLWLRVAAAAMIALAGGLLGYRWPVAVATMLAMPVVWVHTPAMLVATIPLVVIDRREPLPPMVRLPRWRIGRRPHPLTSVRIPD